MLVSDEGNALLADFGLSTAIAKAASDVTTVTAIRMLWTARFSAPELLAGDTRGSDEAGQTRHRSKTPATDIYAFGMLMIQVMSSMV